jgi:hypothetical protein
MQVKMRGRAEYVNNVNGGQDASLDAGNFYHVIDNEKVYSLDVDGFEVIRGGLVVSEDELEASSTMPWQWFLKQV